MADLSTTWTSTVHGLRIEERISGLGRVMKMAIGLPFLLIGLFFLGIVISNLWPIFRGEGWDLIAGSVIALIMSAIFLPLGWWMVLSRNHLLISSDKTTLSRVFDWRIGSKQTHYPASDYRAVLISVEPIGGKQQTNRKGPMVMAIRVALKPRDRKMHNPLEIGWFDEKPERVPDARALANEVAAMLDLEIEDRMDEWYSDG